MDNIVIPRPEKLEKIKKKIKGAGADKFHVLADFDRTLTKAFVNGQKVPSVISVLRDGDYLTPDYAEKAHALFDKYHPIEIDPKIPIEEKKAKMHEWWTRHFDLLIKSGLSKTDLKRVVEEGFVRFRDGVLDFLDFLYNNKIPLIVISSSGVGDTIPMFFEKEDRLYDNIHIITNLHEWSSEGRAIKVKEPIIHCMNKSEIAINGYPVFDVIEGRKNVLLLGDGIGDLGMIEGFGYDNLVKVGFLNEEIEKNLELYKKNFDVVLTGDGDFSYVNELVGEVLG